MALTYDERLLTDSQRLRLRQNNDANFRHAMNQQAHERFVEGRLGFIGRNPGAVSQFERAGLSGEADRLGIGPRAAEQRRLQAHELAMLKQQGENEFKVAEQKRFGMAEQGMKAAEFGANAEIEKAKTEWGAHKDIAQTEAEAKKYGADRGLTAAELEWGKTGADGTRIGGGRETVAGIEGKSRVDAAREQAKIAAEQNEQKRALEEQKLRAAQEKERARLRLSYDRLEAKDKSSIDTEANALAKEKNISFEDARNQIMAAREQQNAGLQEGATRTLSSGRKVVYRGGKWQYVD